MLKILVPTDYSPEAKAATLYAYHFAQYTNSSIVLYHAMPAIVPVTELPYENYYLDEVQERFMLQDTYRQLLRQNNLDPDRVQTEARVDLHNLISTGIEQAFQECNCDLVIMGTHGASGFRKVLLGSNTARFISNTEVPVIAVPQDYRFEPVYHLVYASDLTNLEEELGILVPFAQVFDAALEIYFFDYSGPETEELIMGAELYLKNHPYSNLRLTIKKGNVHLSVSENLRKHLDPSNTQMLILYQGEHNWLDKFLQGSNSQKLLLNPGLPILVLHKN